MTGSAKLRKTFDAHGDSIRPEVLAAFERAWDEIAGPGTWWDGPSRVAIAAAARAARGATSTDHDALPSAALEACRLLATRPAGVTEEWLRSVCDEISEPRYIELVGIVARVMAIDTFHRLAGWPLTPCPQRAQVIQAASYHQATRERTIRGWPWSGQRRRSCSARCQGPCERRMT
jgi:hypothetical protein